MPPVIEYIKNKPQIKRVETFCSLICGNLPHDNQTYKEILSTMDKKILEYDKNISGGALNNCHGDWYEWIIGAQAWNYRIINNNKYLLLMLPNISRFDIATLYKNKLSDYILDLRSKVSVAAGVELITSNPDFVIINPEDIDINPIFSEPINAFIPENIKKLESAYEYFTHKCDFKNIIGYLSVKTSLRPDRRLQIPHEGSLMKALYVHLQTRDWIIQPKGLKYYAASTEVGIKDRMALKTVATHSITLVQSLPQAAVDEVFSINCNADARHAFQIILS